jgi:formate hydrogenlyase transcriptional activator
MQTNMRKPEAKPADEPALSLQEQANLLNVTRDAIFVMDMEGVIKYWNLGAEERYGWTAEQAVGRVVCDLLKTVFPAPLEQVKAEVVGTSRWEGELVHTKKDGTQVVAASRWSLLRDKQGAPVAILETDNDITGRKRAEEGLRETERKYQELVEHANSIILHWQRDGRIIHLNEFGQRFFGYTESEIRGRHVIGTIVPETESRGRDLHTLMDEICANPSAFEQNVNENMRRNGERVWIAWTNKVLLNPVGEVTEILSIGADITARKRAEQALRRSEAYLAEAQRLTHTGSWAWNPATRQSLYWSDEMFRIFGLNPQEGVPPTETFWQRIHPEDLDRTRELLLGAAAGNMEYEHDHRIVLPDGTVKHIHAIGHPVLDENGKVAEYVGTAVDVTERKLAEEALHESETRFRIFVDHAADALFILDFEQGTVVDVNRSACESLGYTRRELIGTPPLAFDRNVDPATTESVAQRTAAGETVIDTHWHQRKDGTQFPVEAHTSQFWYGGRRFLLKVARDISDRLRAEEAVRQSEKQLREVVEGIPAMAFINLADGSNVFVNKRWTEYSGLSAKATAGSGWHAAIHPAELERHLEGWRASTASGSPFEQEVRFRDANGEYRWFLVRAVPLHDAQGNILKWYGILTDIDDRKRAEEKLQNENVVLREEISRAGMSEEIVGASAALQAALTAVSKVAAMDSTVLITGETGTGKEMIARAIHKKSPRSSRAFVSVNCAAIPQNLIASELFGHEKGAFTGATQRRLGRFELAEGGTIFLDEVGDLPAETQVALLRVLQEREFERVGGTRSLRTDVRVIAATNRDLEAAIAAGAFRSDLYYRLNVFPIEVPPLRKRREDIPLLVQYFIARYSRKAGKNIRRVDKRSLELLQSYPWPGNVRELQNVIERSVIVCETETFSVDESWLSRQAPTTDRTSDLCFTETLVAQEKEMIEAALHECGGRVYGPKGAAAKLGMPRTTLESKIRSLKIDKNRFKALPSSTSH